MCVLAPLEREIVAAPGSANVGFRVCRRVQCCFGKEGDEGAYEIKIAGKASSVHWLMTAPGNSCYLITAKGRGTDSAFNVLAYEDVQITGLAQYVHLMTLHMSHRADGINVTVTHECFHAPTKRLASLGAARPLRSARRTARGGRAFHGLVPSRSLQRCLS